MNDFFDTEQSDIDLGIDLSSIPEETQNFGRNELQRNEDWDKLRIGNWNASESKKLMACDRKLSRTSWHNPDKLLAFSDGTLKYIFKKAKERQTGRMIKTSAGSDAKYGTLVEHFAFRRADEELRKQGLYLEKVGYKEIPDIKNAGSSSDAIVKRIDDDSLVGSGEIKCCTSWETLFERTFENTDEKSLDFWQTTQQMLTWNVDKNYYIVISPPSDIFKYIKSDDIDSLYEYWLKETEMEIEVIERSEIHCNALKTRIRIAENTVQRYLEEGGNIRRIFYDEIDKEKDIKRIQSADEDEEKSEFELQQEKEQEDENIQETTDEMVESMVASMVESELIPEQYSNHEEIINMTPSSIDEIDEELPF